MQVSRETDHPDPEGLATAFGPGAETIQQYVDILISRGVDHGLLGPREAARIWQRHILNCASIAPAFGAGQTVADIGSGAGLPGVVLAVARPDLHVTLIEPLLRRSTFLRSVVDELGLEVEVRRARAEDLIGHEQYDAVTARAVAPLARLSRWGLPLVRKGGYLVAMKGSSLESEIADAASTLREFHAGAVLIESYTVAGLDQPTVVVRIESSGATGGKKNRRKA